MATDKEQVQEFLSIAKESIDEYVAGIDFEALSAAKQLILDAEAKGGRLHVTGIGKPGHVSGYAASLFSSTGTPTYELHGTECVHGSAGQTKPGDVVIAISRPPSPASRAWASTSSRSPATPTAGLPMRPRSRSSPASSRRATP